jgi:hypothetical protein
MNDISRIGYVAVTCSFIILGALNHSVPAAQPELERPQLPPLNLTFPHQVVGTLKKPTNCAGNLNVSLRESWYVPSNNASPPALTPAAANSLIGLQNRTLGTSPIDPNTGNFAINWSEFKSADRMPWVAVRNQQGQTVTAYRLLTLLVAGPNIIGIPQPQVLIQFLGNETTKDIRAINVNCVPFG